jgi:hypothetical protein
VDLTGEIEGLAARELRMRMVTIEPGGVFGPLHDHIDRPGTVYVLQGTITDLRDESLRTMGPAWAGPRIEARFIGWRTGGRLRPWRSRSAS